MKNKNMHLHTIYFIPFRKVSLAILFIIFLFPFSIEFGGNGLSANYLFVLFPTFLVLSTGKLRLPSLNLRQIIILYILVFVLAAIYQFSYIEFIERRFISFIIFMSLFTYMFIKIDIQMVQSFKIAIVVISLYFSLQTLFSYTLLGGADLGFAAKGAVGSQRYGFVYVLAIWLLLQYFPENKMYSVIKYLSLLVVGAGLLLTFSRSGIIAIIGSLGLYGAHEILMWLRWRKRPIIRFLFKVVFSLLILSIVILLLNKILPVTFDFYQERLFSLIHVKETFGSDLNNLDSSGGYRFYMFNKIIEFVTYHPFTGSGYLGVWILFDDLSGSAHNQYLDVLFRTGILGFSAYIFLIYRLLLFLHLDEPGLFWGIVGILIYGLFHETFKLSQGGFILAFMFGMMAQPFKKVRKSCVF